MAVGEGTGGEQAGEMDGRKGEAEQMGDSRAVGSSSISSAQDVLPVAKQVKRKI